MTSNPTPDRYRCAEEADAMQWTGSNAEELRAFCGSDFDTIDPEDRSEDPDETAVVRSHKHGGWLGLTDGDWVVKHADHFSVASDEEFRGRWSPATPPSVSAVDQTTRDRIAEAPADRAALLLWAADQIDAETRQAKAHGVLEPDKYRPCRDASAQLRALAGCQECASGLEHDTHCPTPESHNWGCGCPSDVAAAIASCPGFEMAGPSPCRCPCYGCKHHCAAHDPRRLADEAQQPAVGARQPDTETQAPVCEGFRWIGQSFATCDRCGQPAWEHAGEEVRVPVEGAGPFDGEWTVRPWKPGQADAIRAKWGTPASSVVPGRSAATGTGEEQARG